MGKDVFTPIADVIAALASSEGSLANTSVDANTTNADATFYLNVTAASGTTPTLDVDIVAEVDGVDFILGSIAQAIAAGVSVPVIVPNCPLVVKAVYAITGTTPSFTFKVICNRPH